jgi:hypothetical protein
MHLALRRSPCCLPFSQPHQQFSIAHIPLPAPARFLVCVQRLTCLVALAARQASLLASLPKLLDVALAGHRRASELSPRCGGIGPGPSLLFSDNRSRLCEVGLVWHPMRSASEGRLSAGGQKAGATGGRTLGVPTAPNDQQSRTGASRRPCWMSSCRTRAKPSGCSGLARSRARAYPEPYGSATGDRACLCSSG